MSSWFFNIYMNGVVRIVNARMISKGLSLVNSDDIEWKINHLLLANYTVLVMDSEEKLCQLVEEEFGQVCKRRNDELLEEIECFKYLGS